MREVCGQSCPMACGLFTGLSFFHSLVTISCPFQTCFLRPFLLALGEIPFQLGARRWWKIWDKSREGNLNLCGSGFSGIFFRHFHIFEIFGRLLVGGVLKTASLDKIISRKLLIPCCDRGRDNKQLTNGVGMCHFNWRRQTTKIRLQKNSYTHWQPSTWNQTIVIGSCNHVLYM